MEIAQKYSHLNGEEYLIVHHKKLYGEIQEIIKSVDADILKTKISKEKTKIGRKLYSPQEINKSLGLHFSMYNWKESRYKYYITLNRELMEKSIAMHGKRAKRIFNKAWRERPNFFV